MKKKIIIPSEINNDDFERTGISSFNLKLDIEITQEYMEKELVKETDGKFINSKHFYESKN